jgi:hypothetical protein
LQASWQFEHERKSVHVWLSSVPFTTLILTEQLNAEPVGKEMEFGTVDEAVEESKFCSEDRSPAATVDAMKLDARAVPLGYTGDAVSQGSRENEMIEGAAVCNEEGDEVVGCDDGALVSEVVGDDDGALVSEVVGDDDGEVLGIADASRVYTRSSSNVMYNLKNLEPVNLNVSGDSATDVMLLLLLFWK